MKAAYIREHIALDVLQVSEVPKPSIKPGEVLVRVEASGINPSDLASVQGKFPGSVLPRVVGRDFAGKVVEGPAELIGTEVWGTGGDLGISRDGTHGEYLALPRRAVAKRPANLTTEQAAITGVPFITAFSAAVRLGQLKKDEWMIVSGAAGAVGQAAIQLARAMAAHVVALIREASEGWVSGSPGVEAVAQSDRGDLEDVVRQATGGRGADLALNGVGSSIFGAIQGALAVGGRQVVYSAVGGREFPLDLLSFYQKQSALFGLNTQRLDVIQCAGILNEIAPLFESGALQAPAIGERYPLSQAAKAYGRVASHQGGKVVLIMDTGGEDAAEVGTANRSKEGTDR
jgi:NADPH2:quinone reductase